MNDMPIAPSNGPYTVGMGGLVAIAWVGIVIFGGGAALAFSAHQYGAVLLLVCFGVLGVLFCLSIGKYVVDHDGVCHRNAFGVFRMRWCAVKELQRGQWGTLLLLGDNCRLVIWPLGYWTGAAKSEAASLLVSKLQSIGLVPILNPWGDHKWHKNVREK